MSDVYAKFNKGSLKLKGEKDKKRKKKKSKRKHSEDEAEEPWRDGVTSAGYVDEDGHGGGVGEASESSVGRKRSKKSKRSKRGDEKGESARADTERHGGWWKAAEYRQIRGPIAIQIRNCYVKALDNGEFALGAPHDEGDGPDPEEVLLAVQTSDSKLALKSGYDKYLTISKTSFAVSGTSDAIGVAEQWEPVFQDGKTALLGPNGNFLSIDEKEDAVVCRNPKVVDDGSHVIIRSNALREGENEDSIPSEEKGSLGQVELNYVKKFQKFQDHKIKLNESDRRELIEARESGKLHETLLYRRSKMKADRYCK